MKKLVVAVILLFAVSISMAAIDVEKEKKEVKKVVYDAVEFIKKTGKDEAYKYLQKTDKEGNKFYVGDKYPFVFTMNSAQDKSVCLVHPASPKLVGQDMINVMDSHKKYFIRDFVKVAQSKEGEGWVDYYWTHPISKKVKLKSSFIKKLDNETYVGCGVYMEE
ncbi:MAG: cache domain-containing protein [Candidatus Margulisbacteria bacterium]|nr:cache domain-containing protein [Candidatus Margulisiibacteriota bacterium]